MAARGACAAAGDAGDWILTLFAFQQGLAETGYVLGQNVAIEIRSAEGHYNRLVRAPAAGE